MRIRLLARCTGIALACYGALHLINVATDASNAWPTTVAAARAPLTARQQPLVSALTRLLHEDGVQQAERWASAIVRSSPTTDLGYLALVTAQIRRESHFLAPDLEWLYRRIVPDLVHSLGVDDPITTIGPMQVQRWRLRDHFERVLDQQLDRQGVQQLAYDIETGVAACVAIIDRIVTEHVPDRRLRGWIDNFGPDGLRPHTPVLATAFPQADGERRQLALRQKLLSDLTNEPLALDGVRGARTEALLQRHPDFASEQVLRARWQQRFDQPAPDGLPPRITHEPRVALVFADFHSGPGSCRVAALQALCNELCGSDLRCDGKWGPLTRAAMPKLLAAAEPDDARREDFERLLENGNKRGWLQRQLTGMARRLYRERTGLPAPDALVPDLWFESNTTRIKGIGRISVAGYVAGSTAFYEDYLRRLATYLGRTTPSSSGGR